MKSSMKKWMTILYLNLEKGTLRLRKININNGIFQRDSLSSLPFCIALSPLSPLINKVGYGFKINSMVISHLFYIDDVNTFAKIDEEQQRILAIVKAEGHFTTQNSVRDFPDFGNPKKNWPGFRDFVQIWQRFPDFRKFLSRISGFPGISKTFKSTKFHLAFFLAFSPHRGCCAAKIPEVWGCDTPPQQIN